MKYGLLLFMVRVFACFGCNPPQKASDVQLSTLLGNANKGDAAAQFNLGLMYANGEGVPEDDAEAVKWFRKAADQGSAKAQFNLGVMYANGEGVPENWVLAYAYFSLAAAAGNSDAKEAKQTISKSMTSDQVSEGQKMSERLINSKTGRK